MLHFNLASLECRNFAVFFSGCTLQVDFRHVNRIVHYRLY